MAGRKTHEQQLRIIEKREVTSNGSDELDAQDELRRSDQERRAHLEGVDLRDDSSEPVDKDDRAMIRGMNQESRHNKPRND